MSVTAACVLVLVAVIGASGVVIAAVIGSKHNTATKLDQIHVLVNQRLTDALTEIKNLRAFIDKRTTSDATDVPEVKTPPTA